MFSVGYLHKFLFCFLANNLAFNKDEAHLITFLQQVTEFLLMDSKYILYLGSSITDPLCKIRFSWKMVTFQSADMFIFRFYFLSFILIIFPINFISFNENLILLLLSLELWQQDSILSLLCQFLFPMLFSCILVNFLSPDSE